MIFAALTGAAVVTISAIGGIMLPIMIKEGYDAADSTACVYAGSITGPIIPPSLPMVIFGVLSGASVTRMFIGGVVPGIITGLVCMLAWYFMNKKKNYALMPKATPQEIWTAFKKAFPGLDDARDHDGRYPLRYLHADGSWRGGLRVCLGCVHLPL